MTSVPDTVPQKAPLCSAARTALLLDVDKGVRPCCAYEGKHTPGTPSIGRIGAQTLADIVQGDTWRSIARQLDEHEVPSACAACITREKVSGWSQRLMMEKQRSPNWDKGITYLEMNSSNLCNLQCRHCSPLYSSRWVAHQKRHGRSSAPVVMPDEELLLRSLRSVDLSYLETITLKGGEPMLNSDVRVLLRYLDGLGVLERQTVFMVTNGTVIDEETRLLLARVRVLHVCISIDGFGDVQTYIRHGGSSLEQVEQSVAVYAAMPNVRLSRNTSVMAYNVFCLDRIDAWWDDLAKRFPGRYHSIEYGLFVLWPAELAVHCLQDGTREALAARYRALDAKRYAPVIRVLEQRFAGARRHDDFVRQTRRVDAELGRSVLDAIPELAAEMELLLPPDPPVASAPASAT